MPLDIVTNPLATPVDVAEQKAHMRVDASTEDDLIGGLVGAATRVAENYLNRSLVKQTWRLSMDRFPPVIELPRPPVRAVSSITYVDDQGNTQTLASSEYQVDILSEPALIIPAWGKAWPSTRTQMNAVQVTYAAGYVIPFTVNASTDVLTAPGHDLADADVTRLQTTNALPAGLSELTDVYARDVSGETLKLALTSGGAAIDITGGGTGTHFLGEVPEEIRLGVKMWAAHWFEHRETVFVGAIVSNVPQAVELLLFPHRVFE